MFAFFEVSSWGLPLPVALSLVALFGYMVGLMKKYQVDHSQAKAELERARNVIRDLETISLDVRGNLASHHATILQFKERIAEIQKKGSLGQDPQLSEEAERILKPTLELAQQIAHAYDEIRQQAACLSSDSNASAIVDENKYGKELIDKTLHQYFALFARYGNKFSIVLFDIDHFQKINDAHGREHGDVLLDQVIKGLEGSLRETDIVCRIGGEEFAMVLPETDLIGACLVAERLRETIERQFAITISGGVASAMETDSAKSLMTRADTALYSAKAAGGNRVFQHAGRHIHEVKTAELRTRLKAPAAATSLETGSHAATASKI